MAYRFQNTLANTFPLQSHIRPHFNCRSRGKGRSRELVDLFESQKVRVLICLAMTRHYVLLGAAATCSPVLTNSFGHRFLAPGLPWLCGLADDQLQDRTESGVLDLLFLLLQVTNDKSRAELFRKFRRADCPRGVFNNARMLSAYFQHERCSSECE